MAQTEERKAYLKETFDDFDEDKNGSLCRDEIIQLMYVCGANPTDEEVDGYLAEADKNKDDRVDFDEFCTFMEKDPDPKETLRAAFRTLDKDDSGYVDREELEEILHDNKEDEDLKSLLESALNNEDGKIDCEAFVNALMNE